MVLDCTIARKVEGIYHGLWKVYHLDSERGVSHELWKCNARIMEGSLKYYLMESGRGCEDCY